MIDALYLKHFKCFDEKLIQLNRLTVLSGPNSSGKSTIIQALSVLAQTAVEARYSTNLALNGQFVSLGSFSDVVNIHKNREEFGIGITLGDDSVRWTFRGEVGTLSGAKVSKVEGIESNSAYEFALLEKSSLDCLTPANTSLAGKVSKTLLDISHLTADRHAGHEIHHFFERRLNAEGMERPDVGAHGEAAVGLLMAENTLSLDQSDPRVKDDASLSLLSQASAWMGTLFPRSSVNALPIESSPFFRLRFQAYPQDSLRRPESVGYGFSQVFPIVVMGLAAHPSNILLIENPEVHLHPAAQSRLGGFLANCSSAGIQIIVETHSDHIINGIRKAVAAQEGLAKQVTFYSIFSNPAQPGETNLEEILIDEQGRLNNWPKGFFDQATRDARSIALQQYGDE
jgi:predicted ATPase